MMIRYERPVSQAARFARRLGQLAFLLCVAALAAHRFGFLGTPLLAAGLLASAMIALLALALAIVGLQRLWQVGALGGIAASTAILLSLLPLGLAGAAILLVKTTPPVADVTTDHANPPQWLTAPKVQPILLPLKLADTTPVADRDAYPDLTGRRYEGALDRVYRAVTKVAAAEHIRIDAEQGLENAVVDIEDSPRPPKKTSPATEAPSVPQTPAIGPVPRERPEAGLTAEPRGDVLLQGEKRTFLLGLPFEVLIRLSEGDETTAVDIRVAALYGPQDMGFGAEIAESYLRALDAELLGIAGD